MKTCVSIAVDCTGSSSMGRGLLRGARLKPICAARPRKVVVRGACAHWDITIFPSLIGVNRIAPWFVRTIGVTTVVGGQAVPIMCVRSIRAPILTLSAIYSVASKPCVGRSVPRVAINCRACPVLAGGALRARASVGA